MMDVQSCKDLTHNAQMLFATPIVCYDHIEIKRIRETLGEKRVQFGKRFCVTEEAVASWESPQTSKRHRECLGAAGKLMFWAAVEANNRGSSTGNLIRLASRKY